MKLLAIDPGTESSGFVIIDTDDMSVTSSDSSISNNALLDWVIGYDVDHMAVEMIASYGMSVGKTTFETCVWIGRFIQRWLSSNGETDYTLVYRKDVKLTLCQSMRAKDANIRQELLDRYPATGGGKTPQVGTKKDPGPLFGVSSHSWSALAVAHTWVDTKRIEGMI